MPARILNLVGNGRGVWIAMAALAVATVLAHKLAVDEATFPVAWIYSVGDPLDFAIDWISETLRVVLNPISYVIKLVYGYLEDFVLWLPWPFIILSLFIVSTKIGGVSLGAFCAAGLFFMGSMGLWEASLATLVIITIAVVLAILFGVPVGIACARNDRIEAFVRPILDAMQTIPIFVYLVPVLVLFGIGTTAAIVSTVIYASPPVIRLTNLGIRQVSREVVEASQSYGATPAQTLLKVQLPLARPSIMMGINQTIMMALANVIFVALIGSGGLGKDILMAMRQLEVGRAVEAGLAVVVMAIILDRVSYALTEEGKRARAEKPAQSAALAAKLGGSDLSLIILQLRLMAVELTRFLSVALVCFPFKSVDLLMGERPKMQRMHSYARQNAGWIAGVAILLVVFLVTALVFDISDYPRSWTFHFRKPIDNAAEWSSINLFFITEPIRTVLLTHALMPIRGFFDWLPWPIIVFGGALLSLRLCGWRIALFALAGLGFIGMTGLWGLTMHTLAQLAVALILTLGIALPVGVVASQSDRFAAFIRPVLDTTQTLPAFVYFPLIIFLFRVGEVSGVIVTVIYALAPAVRLTNLGIREVPSQVIEVARSYGSSSRQILFKVQLPMARPSIMMGINQTTMMAFAMITYASLIGAPGLGMDILLHTGRSQLGSGLETGICIVVLAILFDRTTQAWAKKQESALRLHT